MTLVEARLASLDRKTSRQPLIVDKADGGQSLGEQLADQQIELMVAHREIERKPKHKIVAPTRLAKRIENRAHHRLANQLWPYCHPMGSTADHLSRLFSCRLAIVTMRHL